MTASRTALQDFSTANDIYVNATITAYTVDDGQKTNIKATLYSNITGTDKSANPQILDSHGKFRQPVYIEEPVILVVTGLGNTPDHDTGIISLNNESGISEEDVQDIVSNILNGSFQTNFQQLTQSEYDDLDTYEQVWYFVTDTPAVYFANNLVSGAGNGIDTGGGDTGGGDTGGGNEPDPNYDILMDDNVALYYRADNNSNTTVTNFFDFNPTDVNVGGDTILNVTTDLDQESDYEFIVGTISSTGTLPGGIVAGNQYLFIRNGSDLTVYNFSKDGDQNVLANFEDGETVFPAQAAADESPNVDFTSQGSGLHTVTFKTLATAIADIRGAYSATTSSITPRAGDIQNLNGFIEVGSDAHGSFIHGAGPLAYSKETQDAGQPLYGQFFNSGDMDDLASNIGGARYIAWVGAVRLRCPTMDRAKTFYFDPTNVTSATGEISITNHNVTAGSPYSSEAIGGGSLPNNMPASGFLGVIDSSTLSVHNTQNDAENGTNPITFTNTGVGEIGLKITNDVLWDQFQRFIVDLNVTNNDHFLCPSFYPHFTVVPLDSSQYFLIGGNNGRINFLFPNLRLEAGDDEIYRGSVFIPSGSTGPTRIDNGNDLETGDHWFAYDGSFWRMYDDKPTALEEIANSIDIANSQCIKFSALGSGEAKFTLTEVFELNNFDSRTDFRSSGKILKSVRPDQPYAFSFMIDTMPASGVPQLYIGQLDNWDLLDGEESPAIANNPAWSPVGVVTPGATDATRLNLFNTNQPHAPGAGDIYGNVLLFSDVATQAEMEESIQNIRNIFIQDFNLNNQLLDYSPDAFTFDEEVDVGVSSTVQSVTVVTISGATGEMDVSVNFGEYRIDGGAWTPDDGKIISGQTLEVRHTTSSNNSEETIQKIAVGDYVASFITVTEANTSTATATAMGTILSDAVFDVDARVSVTGNVLNNIETTPADGETQGRYNVEFNTGFTLVTGSTDYIESDGTGLLQVVGGNTALLNNLHKTTGGEPFTFAIEFETPSDMSGDQLLFGTNLSGFGGIGLRLYSGNGNLLFVQTNGSSSPFRPTGVALLADTHYILLCSYDPVSGQVTIWLNSNTALSVGNLTPATSIDDPSENFSVASQHNGFQTLNNGTKIYGMSMFDKVITDAEATAIRAEYIVRQGL